MNETWRKVVTWVGRKTVCHAEPSVKSNQTKLNQIELNQISCQSFSVFGSSVIIWMTQRAPVSPQRYHLRVYLSLIPFVCLSFCSCLTRGVSLFASLMMSIYPCTLPMSWGVCSRDLTRSSWSLLIHDVFSARMELSLGLRMSQW